MSAKKVVVTRRKEEFHCTECGKYFDTYLRSNMNGNYTIECPNVNCRGGIKGVRGHHHYRKIKDGLVTDDRCNDQSGQLDIIRGLAATLRDTPYHASPEFKRSQMHAVAQTP